MTRPALSLLLLGFALIGAVLAWPRMSTANSDAPSMTGHLLVATPKLRDPRFGRTVILVVRHLRQSADGKPAGTMGFVVNKPMASGPAADMFAGFGVTIDKAAGNPVIDFYYGGPVEPGQGFVLHSRDYTGQSTHRVSDSLSLTVSPDIMIAIAQGKGPKDYLIALGYAGWAPKQLEAEMKRGDWDLIEATPDLVFGSDNQNKWKRARGIVGVAL